MFTVTKIYPCRRSVEELTSTEKSALVTAIKSLKSAGGYDNFVVTHQNAMDQETPSGTPTGTRNAAHRGPAFLPWHREFLIRLEKELRLIDDSVAIPYWDWTIDAELGDPTDGTVWGTDLLGGNGSPVTTGPFRDGEWDTVDSSGSSAGPLSREFGANDFGGSPATLPTATDVNNTLGITPYDAADWDVNVNGTFRAVLEGWDGPGMHNIVHVWVGGDMLPGTSPNDPVFFLHHCMVDKIWADWQAQQPGTLSDNYLPASGGPGGHNINDALWPWPTTAADMLDHRQYYLYDTDPPSIAIQTSSVTFQDIPEDETTYRAVLFDVTTCTPLNFAVSADPGAPFSVLNNTINVDPGRDAVSGEVRFWVGYTGTTDGDEASGSITIQETETGDEWTLNITANTVARQTAAVVLLLDKSGSMDSPSGISGQNRIDVLHYSAPPFVDVIQEGNAIGIASFDHDAYDVMPVTGPLGPPDVFDADRNTAKNHIANHLTNPAGYTAIGDAVEKGHNLLDPESYDVKAMIVLTDGHETASKYISDVSDQITDRVYAIGLGTAEQIQPNALTTLTNGTGGYVNVTGELNNDLYFRLSKYYLQILAGITNQDIVVDPDAWLQPGQQQKTPFVLSETDISCDVILLTEAPAVCDFWIETPQGDKIDVATAGSMSSVSYVLGEHVAYYRFSLPVPLTAAAHSGTWYAVLELNEEKLKKYIGKLDNYPNLIKELRTHGLRYSMNVHSYSNLRMRPTLTQSSYEPGAELMLNVVMTEYGMPMDNRAEIKVQVNAPNNTQSILPLVEDQAGVFTGKMLATQAGVYTFRIMASGKTLRGRDFTREQTLTGTTWKGGDNPPPSSKDPGHDNDIFTHCCKWLIRLVSIGLVLLLILILLSIR